MNEHLLNFGGSFNPIHIGHLVCSRMAAEQAGFDGIRIIPSWINPHKATSVVIPKELKLEMINAAIKDDPFFKLDTIEIDKGGFSYTFDTVSELLKNNTDVTWLVGTDLLSTLHTWHRFKELKDILTLVVVKRPGGLIDFGFIHDHVADMILKIVDVPQMEISSTMIRNRIKENKSIKHLVPYEVEKIIEQHNLYR